MILGLHFKDSPPIARIKCYVDEQGQASQDTFLQMVPENPGPQGRSWVRGVWAEAPVSSKSAPSSVGGACDFGVQAWTPPAFPSSAAPQRRTTTLKRQGTHRSQDWGRFSGLSPTPPGAPQSTCPRTLAPSVTRARAGLGWGAMASKQGQESWTLTRCQEVGDLNAWGQWEAVGDASSSRRLCKLARKGWACTELLRSSR